jgi:hypothetical protein
VDLSTVGRCVVLGISHFTKATAGRDPGERVTGSLAFGALARVVLAAAKVSEEDGGGRVLARAKNKLGPDAGGSPTTWSRWSCPTTPACTPPGFSGARPWRVRRWSYW